MFHKIFYKLIPLEFPPYIKRFDPLYDNERPRTRQQSSKDSSSVLCEERPRIDVFKESFYYRTYIEWNSLPPDIRNLNDHVAFSSELDKYLWNKIAT